MIRTTSEQKAFV